MIVSEIMQHRVVTVDMDATLEDVQAVLDQSRIHHLVVMEGTGIVGVLSDRDYLRNVSPFLGARLSERRQDSQTLQKKVHQIMSRQVLLAAPDMLVDEAARIMLTEEISCLPVADAAGKLVGVVTSRDLLRAAYPNNTP